MPKPTQNDRFSDKQKRSYKKRCSQPPSHLILVHNDRPLVIMSDEAVGTQHRLHFLKPLLFVYCSLTFLVSYFEAVTNCETCTSLFVHETVFVFSGNLTE